jgi:hypothetical protein
MHETAVDFEHGPWVSSDHGWSAAATSVRSATACKVRRASAQNAPDTRRNMREIPAALAASAALIARGYRPAFTFGSERGCGARPALLKGARDFQGQPE